ncbi:MAG: tetratricopeptide repeat protein [Bacteroidetes bacterium]|jgi:tetratricopeptide (TPR) repeat protein|nr:tetratricopeptide repeat protein [Bacteroidota bacterium]
MHKYMVWLSLSLVWACGNKKPADNSGEMAVKWMQSAQLQYDAGMFDSALAYISKVLQTDTNHLHAKLMEGDVYWAQSDFQRAMAAYVTGLRWQPRAPEVWARLGKAYLLQKDYTSALKYFEMAINANPTNADAYVGRAMCFAAKADMEQAYLSLQTAIDFDPDNQHAMLKMGEWLMADSNYKALAYYHNAVRADSSNSRAIFLRAKAFEYFAQYKSAFGDFTRAIQMDTTNFEYIFNLAYFHFQFAEFGPALGLFRRCMRLAPLDLDAQLGKGLCLKEMGKEDQARKCFENMLAIDPNDADALRELATLP